jgi:hypothetical protein
MYTNVQRRTVAGNQESRNQWFLRAEEPHIRRTVAL